MNSGELAKMSDVTVRTLRHYHNIGILAEPPRLPNGYRQYSLDDLVRVLQIKKLSYLGYSLKQMKPVLETIENNNYEESMLDALDKDLVFQIEQLEKQREIIASIKVQHVTPDTPPELADYLSKYKKIGLSKELEKIDKTFFLLLENVMQESQISELSKMLNDFIEPSDSSMIDEVFKGFDLLDDESTEEDITVYSDRLITRLENLVEIIKKESSFGISDNIMENIFENYIQPQYNTAQQKVILKVSEHFAK